MKHKYSYAIAASLLLSANAIAQCTLNVDASQTTICSGDTVTLIADVPQPNSLNSTMAAGNNHRGNMFDIFATNTVRIESFDAHPMGNTTIEIYYRPTPYAGFTTSSAGWILVGSAPVIAQPFGTPTPVPVDVDVTIPAGQTYSFYVTSTNTSISLNYTDGNSEGAVYTSDANMIFRQGVGMEYPFSNGGGIFTPRVWNGVIHYSVPATATYLWSTTATNDTITVSPLATTQYTVTATLGGCPVLQDTVVVTVSVPPVSAGTDAALCQGDSIILSGSGAVSYSWTASVTDGVAFAPAATMDYIVSGTDTIGCVNTDTVNVAVNQLPQVSAGQDFSACPGETVTLSGSGADSYTWDNGVTDGVGFIPSASPLDYIVEGTDLNGCINSDTVTITVDTVNVQVTNNNVTLTAVQSGAVYQWIDCSLNPPVAGATAQSFTPNFNGSYAVIITMNGCTDTSECQQITSVGLHEIPVQLSLYPNPATDVVTVLTGTLVPDKVTIADISGKVLQSVSPVSAQTSFPLHKLASGIYLISVQQGSRISTAKLVKQ